MPFPSPPAPPSWTAPHAPFQMIGDLYYVGSRGISAFLIRTNAGLVLIDAGMPGYAPRVLANIKALGFEPSDVRIILASHAHFDHAGGLEEIREKTGAPLAVMDADVAADERGVYPGSEDMHELEFPKAHVDRVLHDGEKVAVGSTTLVAHKTPGHTAGCTSWSFPVTEKGVVYEALFQCSMSVALNRLTPKPQYPGIVEDYRRTFTVLQTAKADIFLAPHAEQFDLWGKFARRNQGPVNPFIDPNELPRRVADGKAAFETELKRQSDKAASP